MVASLEVVEDEDLRWWLTKGPGLERRREFFLHLCHNEVSTCRVFNGKDDTAFHTDFLRSVEPKDIERRKAAWWQVGAAKSDFESFRKVIVEELKSGQGGEGKQRDDDLFCFGDSEAEPEVDIPEGRAAAEGETGLAKRLSILKKETARDAGRKQQHKRAEKQAVAKEPKKRSPDKKRRSRSGSRQKSKATGSGQKGPLWFGKRREPRDQEESSDSQKRPADRKERKSLVRPEAEARRGDGRVAKSETVLLMVLDVK